MRAYDGSAFPVLYAGIPDADGQPVTQRGLKTFGHPHGFNGSTWDRWRSNTEVELLASGTRSSSTNTPTQTNYNARGMILIMKVTARNVGASPSAKLNVYWKDSITGAVNLACSSDAFNPQVNIYFMPVYPGNAAAIIGSLGGANVGVISLPIPRSWYVNVQHIADITDLTYSLSASYIL